MGFLDKVSEEDKKFYRRYRKFKHYWSDRKGYHRVKMRNVMLSDLPIYEKHMKELREFYKRDYNTRTAWVGNLTMKELFQLNYGDQLEEWSSRGSSLLDHIKDVRKDWKGGEFTVPLSRIGK